MADQDLQPDQAKPDLAALLAMLPRRRARGPRKYKSDPPPDWQWIIDRLDYGHPEFRKALWWAQTAVDRDWPVTPEQQTIIVKKACRVFKDRDIGDPGPSTADALVAIRTVISMDQANLRNRGRQLGLRRELRSG